MKYICKIIFINCEGKLLLQLRDNKTSISYPNHWACVGGEMEDGENYLQTLKREIKEEIDIDYNINKVKFIGNIYIIEENAIINYFRGEVDFQMKDIILREGRDIKLFSYEELEKIKVPEPLRKFLDKHKKEIFT